MLKWKYKRGVREYLFSKSGFDEELLIFKRLIKTFAS
jgi:hypothetical protein